MHKNDLRTLFLSFAITLILLFGTYFGLITARNTTATLEGKQIEVIEGVIDRERNLTLQLMGNTVALPTAKTADKAKDLIASYALILPRAVKLGLLVWWSVAP